MNLCTRAIDAVLAAVIAPPCAVCQRVLDHPVSGAVCDACFASIAIGPVLTTPSSSVTGSAAIGAYEGTLRQILHALKYDGRRSVAARLSRMMAVAGCEVLAGADLVVPVPLHRRRRRERGFNQAHDLARDLGLPIVTVLRRVRQTRPQVELPAKARQSNVDGAFAIAGLCRGSQLNGRIVVLVDDVATTGATLEACANVLRTAGAYEVRALTAARVATPRPTPPDG